MGEEPREAIGGGGGKEPGGGGEQGREWHWRSVGGGRGGGKRPHLLWLLKREMESLASCRASGTPALAASSKPLVTQPAQ